MPIGRVLSGSGSASSSGSHAHGGSGGWRIRTRIACVAEAVVARREVARQWQEGARAGVVPRRGPRRDGIRWVARAARRGALVADHRQVAEPYRAAAFKTMKLTS